MELIQFYSLHILVGSILAISLSLFGIHLSARRKTVEVVLLGQSIQVGILLGVFFVGMIELLHDHHGAHTEVIVSFIFSLIVYQLYNIPADRREIIRTPWLVLIYTALVASSYLLISLSPIVESHMAKSFIGDIVTASEQELIALLVCSLISILFYLRFCKKIKHQSLELALFDSLVSSGQKRFLLTFNILILLLMVMSVHLFGLVFTLAMLVTTPTIGALFNLSLKRLHLVAVLSSLSCVCLSFITNIYMEDLPTSALIAVFALASSFTISSLLRRKIS